jgi:uncharacterized membrane protein YfcA
MTLTYVISGFAVGMLVGLTGVGGGSLMTPLLTLLFGINPTVAVGTDLAFAAITKSAGTIAHRVKKNVHWDIVKRLCLGALPAAVIATIALKYFGALDQHIGQIIRYAIAFSVILTVIAIIFRGRMQAWMNAHPEKQLHGRIQVTATIVAGAAIGAHMVHHVVDHQTLGLCALGRNAHFQCDLAPDSNFDR